MPGKSAPEYQAVCIDLVRNGFVVLAVDPPGQGERKQYYDPHSGELLPVGLGSFFILVICGHVHDSIERCSHESI